MRILIATIAFGVTLAVLFLLSNHGPASEGPGLANVAADAFPSSSISNKAPKATKTPKPTKTLKPTATPLPANSDLIKLISSIPLNFKVKSPAVVSIQTLAGIPCSIKVTLPTGSVSSAQGLEPKTSDTAGNVSWKWNISWNTKPGTGKIIMTCSKEAQSYYYSLPFNITP